MSGAVRDGGKPPAAGGGRAGAAGRRGEARADLGRRDFLKGAAAALPAAAAACGGAAGRPESGSASAGPEAAAPRRALAAGVSLWGQDLGLGELFRPGPDGRTEVEAYIARCAEHGVSRVFAPGASAELVEAGAAGGVEVHPYKAVASHGGIRMYPAWSANFMVPRFGTPEGREVLDAHRPIWSHPRRVPSVSDFLREHPQHRHRNRTLAEELEPWDKLFLSPGLPEGRRHEAEAFASLLRSSGARGIEAEFISINEDEDGVSVDGYEDSIAGAFREETGRDPFTIGNGDPEWVRFRADRWTAMLAEIAAAVRAERPDAVFTATVINREADGYRKAMQDWESWVEQGIVDEMHLWFRSTTDLPTIARHCRHMTETVAGRVPVVAEFSCYHPGSLQTAEGMTAAAEAAREAGMDGLGIYRSHAVEQLGFWPLLAAMAGM